MDFGEAIEALKQGKKVAREGWNGKGMFIYHIPAAKYLAQTSAISGIFESDMVPYGAYLAMKTAQGYVSVWFASQSDMLSEDWFIVD